MLYCRTSFEKRSDVDSGQPRVDTAYFAPHHLPHCFAPAAPLLVRKNAATWCCFEKKKTHRCMDFLFYYPAQIIPGGGYCGGLERCGGGFLGITELEDATDFNRTFGIVDSCSGTLDADEEVGVAHCRSSYAH